MIEPFYIRQSVVVADERMAFFTACDQEARSAGALWVRYSVNQAVPDLCLVEGWTERPDDEGAPRFGVMAH